MSIRGPQSWRDSAAADGQFLTELRRICWSVKPVDLTECRSRRHEESAGGALIEIIELKDYSRLCAVT